MARLAPARPVQQGGQLLDQGVLVLLAQTAATGHDDVGLVQLRARSRSSTWRATILARVGGAGVRCRRGHDRGRGTARRLGGEGLGPDHEDPGPSPVKRAVRISAAAEDGVLG